MHRCWRVMLVRMHVCEWITIFLKPITFWSNCRNLRKMNVIFRLQSSFLTYLALSTSIYIIVLFISSYPLSNQFEGFKIFGASKNFKDFLWKKKRIILYLVLFVLELIHAEIERVFEINYFQSQLLLLSFTLKGTHLSLYLFIFHLNCNDDSSKRLVQIFHQSNALLTILCKFVLDRSRSIHFYDTTIRSIGNTCFWTKNHLIVSPLAEINQTKWNYSVKNAMRYISMSAIFSSIANVRSIHLVRLYSSFDLKFIRWISWIKSQKFGKFHWSWYALAKSESKKTQIGSRYTIFHFFCVRLETTRKCFADNFIERENAA